MRAYFKKTFEQLKMRQVQGQYPFYLLYLFIVVEFRDNDNSE